MMEEEAPVDYDAIYAPDSDERVDWSTYHKRNLNLVCGHGKLLTPCAPCMAEKAAA
jgi:hypothetical protein